MEEAPFLADVAEGPPGGGAHWLRGDDGVRIRVGQWPARAGAAPKGTIFIFPGRCEYIEKYGRTARDLTEAGWIVVAIDWRGQGLSDRLLRNPDTGHVRRFTDYQVDIRAALAHAAARDLPRPWCLLAHSMGGAIAFRALVEKQPFAAVSFSAPMFGIQFAPNLKYLASTVPVFAKQLGMGGRQTPKTGSANFFMETPFEGNFLTSDPDHWAYMKRQTDAHARFRLAGPSLTWLAESLNEIRLLGKMSPPGLPAHITVGTEEKIVDPEAIRALAARWPSCTLAVVDGAEHEIMMERDEMRRAFLIRTLDLFDSVLPAPVSP